jgi:hypothetical protein
MPKYAIDGQDTNTANTTILGVDAGGTARRVKIYDFLLGSDATPADNAAEYHLQRYTVDGTSTAVVPLALDPADPAALCEAGEAHSIEPTYTADAVLMNLALNQRATFRWVAAPGSELVIPATSDNGIGLRSIAVTAAVNVNSTMLIEE